MDIIRRLEVQRDSYSTGPMLAALLNAAIEEIENLRVGESIDTCRLNWLADQPYMKIRGSKGKFWEVELTATVFAKDLRGAIDMAKEAEGVE